MTPDEYREHRRLQRAESRGRESAQKKRWIREKKRQKIKAKRDAERGMTSHPQAISTPVPPSPQCDGPCPPIQTPPQLGAQALPNAPPSPPAVPGPSTAPDPSTPPRNLARKTLYNIKSKIKKLLRLPTPSESAGLVEGLANPKTPEFKKALRKRNFLKSPQKKARRILFGKKLVFSFTHLIIVCTNFEKKR
ncbi:protein enabled homolog [Aplysia californica]|uniref:Protein enabled homolog n=1 Tax=Aplysia californica TaxID=6500 RepID=A0ABM1A3N1_APLCA|nr:protein enabled homolog [Aplysia californica]